ncbi:hypothetical protein NAEGRDRAFT_57108 [Naegleria gruberi]|uniref:E3 ubiquitin ligase UBR4 C-terminal domain-containing protein n=1 Tax=Naegleria gruberi TaxID=5762 RepID=D2V4H6_NAEGR|nr:uncharacterized protein NAEGRDRAFT_57108 [Naegleria gruberi]EFC48519.1 hypothetical protein NAEGRDRAFT_57108 [Naegleria gruberi]|eukprot:XP_002681263.1 hypothetical protein NAEGRDRAFT_57108 [Naegleria gruberi strain NEG-M]
MVQVLNTFVRQLYSKKFIEKENRLEKVIPEKLVAFPFNLNDNKPKEENSETIPNTDIIQQLLIISNEQSVDSNFTITPVIGKFSNSTLSFDKIVKQSRSYLINNLLVGENLCYILNKILSSNYEQKGEVSGVTFEIINLLSKPNVNVCKIETEFLIEKVKEIITKQSVGNYSPDILRSIATLILKKTNTKDSKLALAHFLNGIFCIFNEEDGVQKSMAIYSNYLYLMANIYSSHSTFNEIKPDSYNLPLIVSPMIEKYFPLNKIKEVEEAFTFKKSLLQEIIVYAELFSHANINKVITIVEKAVDLELGTPSTNDLITNFLVLLKNGLQENNKEFKDSFVSSSIENLSKLFKIGENIGDHDTQRVFNKILDILASSNCDIASLNMSIIEMKPQVLRIFMKLVLHNSSDRKIYESIWTTFIKSLETVSISQTGVEVCLFLAFSFETFSIETRKIIFSSLLTQVLKEDFLKDSRKTLLSNILVLFEYLCFNFEKIPSSALQQLTCFIKGENITVSKNLLLQQLDSKDVGNGIFELNYSSNQLSSHVTQILSKDNMAEKLICVLFEAFTSYQDKNTNHECDYFTDVSLRLIKTLMKIENLKFNKNNFSNILAEIFYHDKTASNDSVVERVLKEKSFENVKPIFLSLYSDKTCMLLKKQIEKSPSKKLFETALDFSFSLLKNLLNDLYLVFSKELQINQLSTEEVDVCLDICQSSLAKEDIVSLISSFTSPNLAKISTLNVGEWYDGKLQSLKKIVSELSLAESFNSILIHNVKSVHLSRENSTAFALYHSIKSVIELISFTINKATEQNMLDLSQFNSEKVESLFNIREHYTFRSALLVESILFNIFKDGFVQELHIFKNFTLLRIVESVKKTLLVEKKVEVAKKVLAEVFEHLEDQIFSTDEKKLQSIQVLLVGQSTSPKYCENLKFNSSILMSLLMQTENSAEIFNLLLSFIESILTKVDPENKEISKVLSETEGFNTFIESKVLVKDTRKQIEQLIKCLSGKENSKQLVDAIVSSLMKVLQECAYSNSKNFDELSQDLFPLFNSISRGDKLLDSFVEILDSPTAKKDVHIIESICTFLCKYLERDLDSKRGESNRQILKYLKERTNSEKVFTFEGPVIQSNTEIEENMENNSYKASHSLIKTSGFNVDLEDVSDKPDSEATPIESSNGNTLCVSDSLIEKLISILSELKQEYEKQTTESESKNFSWSLQEDFSVSESQKVLAERVASFAASSFTANVTFERRQEVNIFRSKPMPRHLLASNLSNTMALSEQSDISFMKNTTNFADNMKKDNTRSDAVIMNTHSVPFKVVHIKFNPENDNFLAVAGIYECHVLVLDSECNVIQQIPLYLACEDMPTETYIIDIQWLPGEQCLLSVTTNQFVKVYDLSSDTFCPTFNFAAQDDLIASSVFASDPNGMKDLKTCFALTKKGQLYYQSYFNSGGEATFTDSITITTHNGSSEGKYVFYSELAHMLFVSYADGTSVALQLDHLSGKILSCLELSKDSSFKSLGFFTHVVEAIDMCGVVAVMTSNYKLVLFNFLKDKVEYQILDTPDSHTIQGITSIPPFSKNSSIIGLFSSGELIKYSVTKEIVPCLSLPPKSRIFKELRKRHGAKSVKKVKQKLSKPVVTEKPKDLDSLPIDTETSEDITSKCTFEGEKVNDIGLDSFKDSLDENNTLFVQGSNLKFKVKKPDDYVFTHIQVLVGKSNKNSIPYSILMNSHTIETEVDTEKWYTIILTNQEALDLSELEIEFSTVHGGSNEPAIDSIKIFGTFSSTFRFNYSKKKLEPKIVEETSMHHEEKLSFSSEEISMIYFLNRTISDYFQKNGIETKLSKTNIFSIMAECLMIPKFEEVKDYLISTMISLCDEPKSFVTSKTAVELKYISKKKLQEMDSFKIDIVISKYLEAIEFDYEQVFDQIKSEVDFKKTLYSLIEKNKFDGNLNHDNLIKLYSSILFIEFYKESGSLDQISKFLLDDDEAVRTSCSTSLASMMTFSNVPNDKVQIFTTYLVDLTEKTHDSLSLLNILQLVSVSILKYCSNLKEDEYETSISTFIRSLAFNFTDLLNNLAMKSPASEKRTLIMAMLASLLSTSSDSKFVPSLRKEICNLLTESIPELHTSMVSVCDDMLALFVPGNQADFEDIMGGLLRSQKEIPTRLFSPIFSLAYLEENKSDVFASYPKIVLQVVLRLFKHVINVIPVIEADKQKWSNFFSNIALDETPFIRSIGKYNLLLICGSEQFYNKLMDEKLFKSKLSDFVNGSDPVSVWSPEKARRLVVKVNDIMDSVKARPENWINFCMEHENVLPALFEFSFLLDESVTIPLLLLNMSFVSDNDSTLQKLSSLITTHSAKTLNKFVDFIFNGETNTIRAEAAHLMSKLVQFSVKYKEMLFNIIVKRVQSLPYYGKKGKEFLNNLLIPIYDHYPEKKQLIADELAKCLQSQNGLICNHPNSYIYDTIQQYISVEPSGYYLETTPCLVCSDPELDFKELNLQDIIQGQKQSHSSHYYKLSNSYTIESMSIDISDFKRSKMIRTVEIYFNNNQALDANDLPKNSTVWQRAGTMNVAKGEQSATLTFSVPVTCCNLLVEFSSFYFDLASMDALFCDSCGIAVYDKYGLCLSCGENVFSCSNCRGINYDNLDAFICSTCGTCKFATFAFSLSAKQVFIGDKIRNEDDCKKSLQIIDNQLNSSEAKLSALKTKSSEIKSLLVKLKTGDYGEQKLSEVISSLQDVYNNETKTLHGGLSHCQKLMLTTRKHLREYISANRQSDKKYYHESTSSQSSNQFENKCYGCANNFVSNVMDFFLTVKDNNDVNFNDNLVEELFKNISRGGLKEKSFKLLTCLSFGNEQVSEKVNSKLKEQIVKYCRKTLKGYDVTSQLVALTELLKRTFDEKDPFFNNRIQLLFEVLLETSKFSSSVIICEEMIKPCLIILQKFISYGNSKPSSEHSTTDQTVVPMRGLHFGYHQVKEGEMTFEMFKNNQIPKKLPRNDFDILGREFLSNTLLNLSSNTVRELTLQILQSLCLDNSHKQIGILQALTALLSEAMKRGEVSSCFFKLFNELVKQEERKTLLSSKGFLSFVCKLLKKEVSYIHKLENSNTNQSQDLSTGSSLYFLVSLLSEFLIIPEILTEFKTNEQHISTVLGSFLSLKSLVVQKTKATTDSYEMLKSLTEKLQDTEDDKKLFIAACVDTLKLYSDNRTALFVFEKLNNIIQPIKEEPVFKLKLVRAASQEFYFQGRLSRQTWNSVDFKNSSGGPALMSDVKDKICEELSIHSDIPFELLVNNKIIALNLPVTRVYEKVWLTRNMEGSTPNAPMEVIYRFQGIDEASEDNVDTLPSEDDSINIAQRCKITGIISKYGGIEVMVSYLRSITDFSSDKSLAKNLLQFMQYCTNVKLNRRRFLMIDSVECLLSKCKYVFQHGDLAEIAELLLLVIRPLIKEATKMSHETPASPLSSPLSPISADIFNVDSSDLSPMSPNIIGKSDKYKISNEEILEQLKMFLERLPVCSTKIVGAVQSILPFLTYGLEEPMNYLIQYFEPYLKFETFENTTKQKFYLDSFVNVVTSIPNDFAGNNLKTQILQRGITKLALDFVLNHFGESQDWKSSLSLPALPYALNLLQGLVTFHSPTHNLLNSEPLFRILHKIEENTEEKMIATYAESLLNSIAEGSSQSKSIISNIRKSTKEEKKKKAMSKREKTLKQLKQPKITFNFDEAEEEDKGILCSVCGDGNSFKPEEVLGTYMFCKHCYLSDNSSAISSVTQFNTIHSSCHTLAVTADQNRNPPKTEWEGAQIRNSFTKCNALFPFKGPKTSASNYSNAVQKYVSDLSLVKNTGRESFDLLSHDLMLLLNKFAKEESFSKDSGGGSAIHQVKLIPFMIQMGIYILDTLNKNRETQETLLTSFLSTDMETTLELENISYNAILSLYLMTLEEWNHYKKIVIERVVSTIKNTTSGSEEEKFNAQRPALIFVALIDAFQNHLKSPSGLPIKESIKHASTEEWIVKLSKKLESIDQEALSKLEGIATLYTTQLLKFTSVEQFEQIVFK